MLLVDIPNVNTEGLPLWLQILMALITLGLTAWSVIQTQRNNKIEKHFNAEVEKIRASNESKKTESEVKNTDFKTLVEQQQKFNQELALENKQYRELLQTKDAEHDERERSMQEQILKLKDEVSRLKYRFLLNSRFNKDSFPFARWKKDSEHKIVEVDNRYIQMYYEPAGINPTDALGKTDSETWGEDIGKSWSKGDEFVYKNMATYIGIEKTIKNNVTNFELVVKYPSIISDNQVKQTEGFVIPINIKLIKDFTQLIGLPDCDIVNKI